MRDVQPAACPVQVSSILGLAVSSNHKYFACIETLYDSKSHQVTVYSVKTSKRVRTLHISECDLIESQQVAAISFGDSDTVLYVQACAPDWKVVAYTWRTALVLGCVATEMKEVQALVVNPSRDTVAAVVGPKEVRVARLRAHAS